MAAIIVPSKRLARLYGEDFPNPKDENGESWRRWLDARYTDQKSSINDRKLHYSRHRNFRQGRQWISSRDGRTWREPKADSNTVRVALNIIGPSLDFRLGLLEEQRPGFRHEPLPCAGVSGREQAEAQQSVVEHYYY